MEANYIAGTPYIGAKVRMYGAPGGYRGEISAWDPVKAKPAWSIKEKFPVWSGAVGNRGRRGAFMARWTTGSRL